MNKVRPVVVFVSHRNQLEHFALVARELDPLGYSAELWTVDKHDAEIGRGVGGFARVIDLTTGFRRQDARDSRRLTAAQRTVRDLERRTGPFLHQDLALDRAMTGFTDAAVDASRVRTRWTLGEGACLTAHLAARVGELLGRPELAALVGETNTLPYRVVYRLARLADVPHLNPSFVAHSDGRTVYERSLTADWTSCLETYRRFLADGVPEPDRLWAEAKRDAIVHSEEQDRFVSTMRRGSPRVWQRWAAGSLTRSLEEWSRARGEASRNSPRGVYPELLSPWGKLRRSVQAETRSRYYESVAQRRIPAGAYACYFLHVQPESTVDCLAFEYMDQVATIRNIAATLPADVVLAVKEHRVDAGRRAVAFYSELSAIPGVVLVHDTVNSIALIKSSRLVLSLTGTVSVEAGCCGVPAVVFGDVYYGGFRGITRVSGYAELREQLHPESRLPSATPEEAVAALAARRAAAHEGDLPWVSPRDPTLPATMARSLVAELVHDRHDAVP